MEVLRTPVNQAGIDHQCDFCSLEFDALSDKNEHILSHFEQEICSECDQNLLRIGGHLYILHARVTCIARNVKLEPDSEEQRYDDGKENPGCESVAISERELGVISFAEKDINHSERQLKQELDSDFIEDSNPLCNTTEVLLEEPWMKFDAIDSDQIGKNDEFCVQLKVNDSCKQNKNNSELKCAICMKTFKARYNLHIHTVRVHCPQEKKFKCDKCKLTYATRRELKRHNKIKQKVCERCTETFCSNALLQFHRENLCWYSKLNTGGDLMIEPDITLNEPNAATDDHRSQIDLNDSIDSNKRVVRNSSSKNAHKCSKCKMKFSTKFRLNRHLKIKPKVCEHCNETFCANSMLRWHQEEQCPKSNEKSSEYGEEKKFAIESDDPSEDKGTDFDMSQDILDQNEISSRSHDSSQFQCHPCSKTFKSKYNLSIHNIRIHTPSDKLLKCAICKMSFATKRELDRHNKIVPKICNACNEMFCAKSMLLFHQEELCTFKNDRIVECSESNNGDGKQEGTNKKITKSYTCEICDKTFSKKPNLRIHFLRIHAPSQMNNECERCGQKFVRRYELENHRQQKIICNQCGESFCSKSLYSVHQQQDCEVEKFSILNHRQCKQEGCNELVAPNNWIHHMTTKHNDRYKRFECDICKKTCSSKTSIRSHILTIHCPNSRKFKCDLCEVSCISKSLLRTHHKKTHLTGYNFICSECGRTFKQRNQLKLHSHVHTGAKPFVCLFKGCTKRFRGTPQRIEHMRMHTGEKPFVCPVEGCDRRFAYSVGLRRHKFSAHKIYTKKYPCQICSEIFSETILLKRHMKKHENQI